MGQAIANLAINDPEISLNAGSEKRSYVNRYGHWFIIR